MLLLSLGIVLFALVHFIPSLAPSLKSAAVQRVGDNGYKGLFSLLLLVAIGLIIVGWRSAHPVALYLPPVGLHEFALALLAFAFLLLVVSTRPSRLRLLVRHPQLTGVALWGIGHLLLNGDNRTTALFGGMAVWAIIEIVAISRREGTWIKAAPPSWGVEAVTLLITVITIAVVVYSHPWLSGMPVW